MTIAEKLTAIAERVPVVYEAGRQSEYDRFWDTYQQNGNRTDYQMAFCGKGWTAGSFKPKYDIKPSGRANNFIYNTDISGDLAEMLENQNVTLDLSGVTRLAYGFAYSSLITRLGVLDLSSCDTSTTYVFTSCSALRTIDKVIVTANTVFTYWFDGCTALEAIRFEGTIGNSLDIHWSTELSAESIQNIIEHLGGSASATLTLPTTAESNYDAVYGSGAYATLIASRPSNWTIAYL